MTLAIENIPEEPTSVPGWLESQLVGARLRELVAELAAARDAQTPDDSVRDYLGESFPLVHERGLSVLRPEQVQGLLRQPYYLLELQDIVLIEGSPYWDAVPPSAEIQEAVVRLRPQPVVQRREPFYRKAWFVMLATAASVLVAVFALQRSPTPTQWGWSNESAFAPRPTETAYLAQLADGVNEWFQKPPTDSRELVVRLTELRRGCAELNLRDHPSLSPAKQKWLAEKCKAWSAKVEVQLAKVENRQPFAEAKSEADEMVRKFVVALRTEAGT